MLSNCKHLTTNLLTNGKHTAVPASTSFFHAAEVFLTNVPVSAIEKAHALLDGGAALALFAISSLDAVKVRC